MSLRVMGIHDKIKAVEDILCGIRRGGSGRVGPEAGDALKEIAKDLRAKLPGRQSVVIDELERRLVSVERAKRRNGYEVNALIGLAQEIIRHWPVIRQALERE